MCDTMSTFIDACCNGDISTVEQMLQKGIDLNQTDSRGWSPLSYAHYLGEDQIMFTLLRSGANINQLFVVDEYPVIYIQDALKEWVENHTHELSPENLKAWKKYRLQNVFRG